MITKVAKIGKIVPDDMFPENTLGLNYDYRADDIVFICFNNNSGNWRFENIEIEEYSSSKIENYLMKSPPGSKRSEFPTIDVFRRDDLIKNEKADFDNSKAGNKFSKILEKYKELFKSIIKEINENEALKTELAKRSIGIKRFALSIKLNGKYIGESPEFAIYLDKFKKLGGNADYYTYDKKVYEAMNKVCSITGNIEDKVWGYASPYKFYAVKTELGAVPGGFDARFAWKNFPVSPKGVKWIEKGDKFIKSYLSFRFCGYNYFLIPEKVLDLGNDEAFLDYIQGFKRFTLKEGTNRLEEDLLDLIADEEKNAICYSLFFYEENNSEFKILASVDDVFPSYMSKILKAKKYAEQHDIFFEQKIWNETANLELEFSHFKEFIPEPGGFLEIIRAVFMQKKIDFYYLLGRIMRKVQTDYTNDELYPTTILKGFLILKFLQKLELITQETIKDNTVMENKYEDFFEAHNEFFNSNAKKAAFLMGVLAQFLLNIQHQERGAAPFRSKLNSLKLNERLLKKLLPEIIDKLEQYDKNYYCDLETVISEYMLDADFSVLKEDEISFYFSMGMNLHKKFKAQKESKEQINEPVE